MKKLFTGISFCLLTVVSLAQSQPKLVVGIMVDQMRWDYLYRYQYRYGNDGFNRLLNAGFSCENAYIPYTPTYTAAGHTCVYTGSVPALHGIIGNNWYDRDKKKLLYCTADDSVQTVGGSGVAGQQSPRNLWANTISDEMRLSTNFRSKTIAIALKDRGSILPGGHTANAAYWFDNETGGWISSSFYMKELPAWVKAVNAKKDPDQHLKKGWKLLYASTSYRQSTADDVPYEDDLPGEDHIFDHQTQNIVTNKYESFRYTPMANTYTFDMAKAAIKNEQLGQRGVTDLLAVSFSATDYAGHKFGPNSMEMEDMYLRFDKELASFLNHLDASIGKGQYLVFFTADHGVAHVPGFEQQNRLPAGLTRETSLKTALNDSLKKRFHLTSAIQSIVNYQLYLSEEATTAANKEEIKSFILQKLLQHPGVSHAFDLATVSNYSLPQEVKTMVVNGYSPTRSGDLQFIPKPQWFSGYELGTTHGVWNPYDAHIPLIWYGWKVKPGKLYRQVSMTDIAPTLAAQLRIQAPNASIGKVIEEVVR